MPFNVKKSGKGYKVFSPHGAKSKKPMSKSKAKKQQAAIYANWKGESIDREFSNKLDEALGLGAIVESSTSNAREIIHVLAASYATQHERDAFKMRVWKLAEQEGITDYDPDTDFRLIELARKLHKMEYPVREAQLAKDAQSRPKMQYPPGFDKLPQEYR
jgi:hypothetical protein